MATRSIPAILATQNQRIDQAAMHLETRACLAVGVVDFSAVIEWMDGALGKTRASFRATFASG